MANDWIPIRCNLFDDPAVISVATATGLDEYGVVGRLVKLWAWANQQTADGNAPGVTEMWLDRYLGVSGFAQALIAAGWLVTGEAVISIPKFDQWNSQSAKKRVLTNQRVSKHRGNAVSVTGTGQSELTGNAVGVSKALPEKRREEKREHKDPPNPPQAGGGPVAAAAVGPPRKRKRVKAGDVPDHPNFAAFWAAYPRREKRAAANKALTDIDPAPELFAAMLAAITAQKRPGGALEARVVEGRSTIPHPTTWLNGRRWEDESTTAGGGHGSAGGGTGSGRGLRLLGRCPPSPGEFDIFNDPPPGPGPAGPPQAPPGPPPASAA